MPFPDETTRTQLSIAEFPVHQFSATGLTQTIEPADGSGIIRTTINGTARDRSSAQFRKYKSTISCTDLDAPAFDGIWPGQILTVDCAIEFSYAVAGGASTRTPVSGSSVIRGDFVYYRPQLVMMVMPGSPRRTYDEWGAANGWAIDLLEVELPVVIS
jgi:hypothetical protein